MKRISKDYMAGVMDATIYEDMRTPVNHGFSIEICIPLSIMKDVLPRDSEGAIIRL